MDQRSIDELVSGVMTGAVNRRQLLTRAAILGISGPTLVALLAACGSGDDDATATPGSGGTDPTATTGGEATAPSGEATTPSGEATATTGGGDTGGAEPAGEIVIMQGVDANNLDPLLRNATPEFTINLHVFDMMLNRDPETLEILPNVVASWENVDDLTWEFTLVEGATFHDGTPVNAEAAVFTFERAAQDQIGDLAVVQSLATQIGFESVEAIDELSFRVTTNKPAAIFPDLLTSFELCPPSVYSDESPENLATVAENPVGSGPYTFVEWVRDDHITLEANPDYWGGPPAIQTIVVRPVPELSARVVALQNGEANIIVNVSPDVVDQVEDSDVTRISSVTGGRNIFVGIRCDTPPFDDVRVRQALNYAVDWDSIKTALLGGYGERTATIVNPPNADPTVTAYPYDPDMARQLLQEAGVEEGFEVTMDAPSGRYIKDAELAQAIAQNFDAVGFKINLRVLEWSIYAGELLPSGNPDPLFFLGLGSPFSGEQELFYVHPDFSLNYTFWQDEEYVAAFAELNETIDPERRTELMNQLQALVHEGCPWVFLWHQVDFYGASRDLQWDARADERIDVSQSSYL